MARAAYQYGTSPRKYEPEYTTRKITKKTVEPKKVIKKSDAQKRIEKQRAKKAEERKNKTFQVAVVIAIFAMLLAISYREISIMEMFNQKKKLENQLAVIEKENGQVEKSIKEEESKLDWNQIKKRATEELGMQVKTGTPIDLEKSDNIETETKFIKEEENSFLEKIVGFIIGIKK